MNFQHGMHPDELQYPSPEFDGVMPLRCCVVVALDNGEHHPVVPTIVIVRIG